MKNPRRHTNHLVPLLLVAGLIFGFGGDMDAAWAKTATPFDRPANFSDLAKKVGPSVVNIRTEKSIQGGGRVFRHFFGNPRGENQPHPFGGGRGFEDFFERFFGNEGPPEREFKQQSLGSGFIIDKEGYVVTNNHVVENATNIKVKLADGREFEAEIVGRDPKTDLALIKIPDADDLQPIEMGDSEALQVGQWVVALGSPFGLERTVTAGIVSAKGRVIGSGPYDDFIQTDASINPGNSGGPLVNMDGDVVGINTAIIASGQGIGFAIPANMAEGILNQLRDKGSVTRGWLGVGIQDLTPELAEYYGLDEDEGVLVTQVYQGEPAAEAGIEEKDVIVSVDGEKMASSRDLSRVIASKNVGKEAEIEVLRDGRRKTIEVTIGRRDDETFMAKVGREDRTEETLGLTVASLTPERAARIGVDRNEKGVVVTNVAPDGKGAEAGIRSGDIIKEINRKPVDSIGEYKEILGDADEGDTLQFFLRRGNAGFLVAKVTK